MMGFDSGARPRRFAGEVPGGERKCNQTEAVGEQSQATGVNLPAPPEGEEGGDEKNYPTNGIHRFY
jgi:hypothetical protein